MTSRSIARIVVIALMGVMVVVATGDGFAQSYSGLYGWALEHKVAGWKAESFPLLVDLFIGVGELGLFLLAIDGHKLTRRALSWVDLLIPGGTALGGWVVSLIFNVGHVRGGHFSDQATAAIPPVASMVGLVILLRTLHRYVAGAEEQTGAAVLTVSREQTPDRATVPAEVLGPAEATDPLADQVLAEGGADPDLSHLQPGMGGPPDPGQGAVVSLDDAVMSARTAGMSVRAVSEAFNVTRYRVEKLDKQRAAATDSGAPATVNGFAVHSDH